MATPISERRNSYNEVSRGTTSRRPTDQNPYGSAYTPSGSTSSKHGASGYTGGGTAYWDGTGRHPGDDEINRRFLGTEASRDRDLSRYGVDSQERTARYGYDTDRYGYDRQLEGVKSQTAAQRYGADKTLEGTQYSADKGLEGLIYGRDVDRDIQGTFDRRHDAAKELFGLRSGFANELLDREVGGGGGSLSGVSEVDPSAAAYNPAEVSAADRAEFGTAADRVANLQRGALRGLRSDLASRGLADAGGASGIEAQLANDIRSAGTQELVNTVRSQQQDRTARGREVADRNLSAALQRRGQDITRRGQDASARNALLSIVLGGGGAVY